MARGISKAPAGVIVTITSCAIYIVMAAAMQVLFYTQGRPVAAGAAVILGFIVTLVFYSRGNRLSRAVLMCFIYFSLFAVAVSIIMPAMKNALKLWDALMLSAMAAPLLAAIFAVSSKGSRLYAGYICPICGSAHIRGMDITLSSVKCRDCGNVWD